MSTTVAPDSTKDTSRAAKAPTSDRSTAENRLGLKLVAPAVVMMLLVTAWPMLQALYLSLFRYRLTTPDDREFVGISNYTTVLTDSLFWQDTWNTVLIMVVTVAVELVIGFAFAMVMHKIVFARGAVRTSILIPYGIITVVSAYAWQFAFSLTNGFVNGWLPFVADDFNWFGATGRPCSRSWSPRSGRPPRSWRCCCSPASRRSPRTCWRPPRSTVPPGGNGCGR